MSPARARSARHRPHGQAFGPVNLFLRDGRGWITGGWWPGEEWLDDNDLPVQPVAFSFLPPDPPVEWG